MFRPLRVEAFHKFSLDLETASSRGGSPGLVVMELDSCSEVHGFKSRHRILDGYFSHVFVVKIVMMFV